MVELRDKTFSQRFAESMDTKDEVYKGIRYNVFHSANPVYFETNSEKIWKAAFNQYNPVVGMVDFVQGLLASTPDEEGYDVASDPLVKDDIHLLMRSLNSGSRAETRRIVQKVKEEQENLAILNSSDSQVASLTAAFASPTTILPFATLRGMGKAYAHQRFISGAAYSTAVIAPEQLILQATREEKPFAETAVTLASIGAIGGTLNSIAGPTIAKYRFGKAAQREAKLDAEVDGPQIYKSAGASVSPEKRQEGMRAMMYQDAAKETGIKAEKLGYNPVFRLMKSENYIAKKLPQEMVDMGGVMTKGVDEEVAMADAVETTIRTKYYSQLLRQIRSIDGQYLNYRQKNWIDSDIKRGVYMAGLAAKDRFDKGAKYLNQTDFRIRVGKAMVRGDVDAIDDVATPFVNAAAKNARKQLDSIKKGAEEVGMFTKEIEKALAVAKKTADGSDASAMRIKELTNTLNRVRGEGVSVNTAESYLPRIYRIDRIMDNPNRFALIVKDWAMQTKKMTPKAASKYADEILDSVTKGRPYLLPETDDLDFMLSPSSVRMRSFEIPDELIEDFLERDIETILRHHTRTMGTDIELTRAFGSFDMKGVIDDVTKEYDDLISKATGQERKTELRQALQNDLRDIRGLRDRLRGTYGASKDPHQLSSRFIRAMKSFNVIVGMGGAMVSSVPDVVRVTMVEGLNTSFGKILKVHFRSQSKAVQKLSKSELRKAAVAVDAVLGLRAHSFADTGDMFGNRLAFERILTSGANAMFMVNGLNAWNQVLKEIAGNVTMLRMTEGIMKPWKTLSKADKEKFLKNGIDENAHMQMQFHIKKHGEKIDGEWLPNTDDWNDVTMRLKFRNALNQNVDRIIVTPGAGDRALWTSTELGSMLTQFKSFGQSATQRMVISGLQERDGAFMQGAVLLVGMGLLVNEIKRSQYGIDRPETFQQKLVNAVDRSGITGFFMDVNNAVEKLSHNRLGLRSLVEEPRYMPFGAKMNAVLGPAGGTVSNFGSIATDILTGQVDKGTAKTARFVTPLSNHPVMDPFYDVVYGTK